MRSPSLTQWTPNKKSLQPLFNILRSFHARGFVLVGKNSSNKTTSLACRKPESQKQVTKYKLHYASNGCRNRCVFLKVDKVCAEVTSEGKPFQTRGAATPKTRSRIVSLWSAGRPVCDSMQNAALCHCYSCTIYRPPPCRLELPKRSPAPVLKSRERAWF